MGLLDFLRKPQPKGFEPLNPQAQAIRDRRSVTVAPVQSVPVTQPAPNMSTVNGPVYGGPVRPVTGVVQPVRPPVQPVTQPVAPRQQITSGVRSATQPVAPVAPVTTPVSAATAQLQKEAENMAKYGSALGPQATPTAPTPPTTEAPVPENKVVEGEVVPPTPKFIDTYRGIYDQLGLGDIRTQIESTGVQLQELQDKKVDEISLVNENPWLTEGQRQDRVNAIDRKYAQKEGNLINRIELFQSTFEQGRQEAQFIASQTAEDQRAETSFQRDQLERRMDAERKLKEAGEEILSVDDARALGLPYGTTVKEAKAKGVIPETEVDYSPGIIGEYQFYAEQEEAQGRTPLTFDAYQTRDSNRKATKVSGGGATGGAGFTPTERKKLEAAGLLGASREQQLEYLYGAPKPSTATTLGELYEEYKAQNPGAKETLREFSEIYAEENGIMMSLPASYKLPNVPTTINPKDLTATDRKKMIALGLDPNDQADINEYVKGAYAKKEGSSIDAAIDSALQTALK